MDFTCSRSSSQSAQLPIPRQATVFNTVRNPIKRNPFSIMDGSFCSLKHLRQSRCDLAAWTHLFISSRAAREKSVHSPPVRFSRPSARPPVGPSARPPVRPSVRPPARPPTSLLVCFSVAVKFTHRTMETGLTMSPTPICPSGIFYL